MHNNNPFYYNLLPTKAKGYKLKNEWQQEEKIKINKQQEE